MKLAALLFAGVIISAPQAIADMFCGNSAMASGCVEISKLEPSVLLGAAGNPSYRVAVSVGTIDPWASALAITVELTLADGKSFTVSRLLPVLPILTPVYFDFLLPGPPAAEPVKLFSITRHHAEPKDELGSHHSAP